MLLGRVNFLPVKLLLAFIVAGSLSAVFGAAVLPSCAVGNVAGYARDTSYPGGGCAIGILDYYDFSYHPLSNAPLASAIGVSPEASGFSFGPVSAAPGQTVEFEIDYDIVIDPAPIITGDKLGLDPPKGNVVVTEFFCNDVEYVFSGSCLGSNALSLTVGTPGTNYPSSAQITFSKPATTSEQVGILFTLVGGTTGASFDGLDSTSVVVTSSVPEPPAAAALLLGVPLLTWALAGRRRKRPVID
jgi:hypothetical protein